MSRSRNIPLAIVVVLIVFFLVLPVLIVIPVSLQTTGRMALPSDGLSLQWFEKLLSDPSYLRAMGLSGLVAVLSTAIAVPLGGILGYAAARATRPLQGAARALSVAPLLLPAVSLGVALYLLMQPLMLVRTLPGVVLAHVLTVLPLCFALIYAGVMRLGPTVEEAAISLGASPLRVLATVVVPNLRASIASAAVLAMIVSLDEVTLTLFVGESRVLTAPVMIMQRIQFGLDPTVAALSTVIVAIAAFAIVAVERSLGLRSYAVDS
jgi:mannopine transport system permease protein